MTPDHPLDELSAYALGCLSETEVQAVERHLAVCADCRAEAASLREAAAQLAMIAPQVQPPVRVKQALLARVHPESAPARKNPWTILLRTPGLGWGAAALALIVVLLVGNLLLLNQVRTLTQDSAANFHIVALQGADPAETARGVMIVTASGYYGTLVVDGLPDLGAKQQYQLWLILDGQRTSGGVFSVDTWGYGAMVIDAPLPLDTYTDFGVTIEPAGGSPRPTGDKVLGGSF